MSTNDDLNRMSRRLDRLEKQNRLLKLAAVPAIVVAGAALLLGAGSNNQRKVPFVKFL